MVTCALIGVAWLVSMQWGLVYESKPYLGGLAVGVVGVTPIARDDYRGPGWHVVEMGGQLVWQEAWFHRWPELTVDIRKLKVVIPLWIPFVLLAVPTAILWYRDRRHPLGHCRKCGYNLTGNVSGVCPECGMETES